MGQEGWCKLRILTNSLVAAGCFLLMTAVHEVQGMSLSVCFLAAGSVTNCAAVIVSGLSLSYYRKMDEEADDGL